MSTYHEMINKNPFKQARGSTAQLVIARRTNVTTQYIYRHEVGLINSPSGSLCEELDVTEESYWEWVSEMRRNVLWVNGAAYLLMIGPYGFVSHLQDQHPFITFMYNFNHAIAPQLGMDGDYRSQQLFNRLLCIHPRSVQLYLSGGDIAQVLSDALTDVGINLSMQTQIHTQVQEYRKRVKP